MHVPKTAADVNDFSEARKNQIGSARKLADVKAITPPHRMNEFSDHHLRRRVLGLDRRHNSRAFCRRDRVNHEYYKRLGGISISKD